MNLGGEKYNPRGPKPQRFAWAWQAQLRLQSYTVGPALLLCSHLQEVGPTTRLNLR